MATPNYELLKDAYAVIDGIPNKAIDLYSIRSKEGKSLDCGTVCCAAGWLANHPKFNALGLTLDADGRAVLIDGKIPGHNTYSDQMAKVFGISELEASRLFNSRQDDDPKSLSEKQVWLRRVRKFLKLKGQL